MFFDFLGTADPRREAELEQKLIDHIQQFLLELGSRFCLCRTAGAARSWRQRLLSRFAFLPPAASLLCRDRT